MSNYIIGDIQGCFDELELLLEKAKFSTSNDVLWVVGDLVARGPKSLKTLRFIKSLGKSARVVLGNHDLHLLSVSLGLFPAKKKDKTSAILKASDRDELLTWLRHQPLLAEHDEFVICHAGISPQWTLSTARKCAEEVEAILRGDQWPWLVKNMYDNKPNLWSSRLEGIERYRYIINAFTRMRYCFPDASLDMECKRSPKELVGSDLKPWFELKRSKKIKKTILFGHWAALEGCNRKRVIGLDTGCVWGGRLTMIRWEDRKYFTQRSVTQFTG
ncbi:bis(5'-nucleosyl)-tetraphosphatase, symmetrical [Vibrio zhanjiangensis]|uniref:Bis(5'-nucleosyl)-tetraphosphatase, symmetrical n=1 Tax=Vibrio zhanjiangensis TaxID=1046128 RepID=A0ABQ6EXR7_9VIBR|nr:symmetrical bis(5'-nucleosyl)-tetraphosphatase [Vibrio zhanjiangensis]GLT17769.1 bis(5'-nucleosyl)-tetraphosphatase, symmetrical [Vibrio zhanjiangensis]